MTGKKEELVMRCADGKVLIIQKYFIVKTLGAIPRCSICYGGRPRFNNISGGYRCPGFMEDTTLRICN